MEEYVMPEKNSNNKGGLGKALLLIVLLKIEIFCKLKFL